MPNPDGAPTEAEFLEGRYPGAEEECDEARRQTFEAEQMVEWMKYGATGGRPFRNGSVVGIAFGKGLA